MSTCGESEEKSGPSAAGVDLVESVTPRIESYIEETIDDSKAPAVAIGIVADDRLVYSQGFGEREGGGEVDAETLFEIGSASKAFLGATEAILVDREKLAWNDRVIDHYPRFRMKDPWVTREFRIVDLLAQRSGLLPYAGTPYNTFIFTPGQAIEGLAHLEPSSSFRSEFAYQNVPHLVASEIVAEKVGVPSWNEAVERLILKPTGMDSSLATQDALARSENSTRGHQLTADGDPRRLDLVDFPSSGQGAGSIVSNVTDMARWLRLQINQGEVNGERVVSARQIRETHRPRITVEGPMDEMVKHGSGPTSVQYATGWFVHSLPEGRIIEHGGNTLGYAAAVRFDPDRKLGVVVLTNLNQGEGSTGYSHPVAAYTMDLLQGREPLDYARIKPELPDEEEPAQNTDSGDAPERPLAAYAGRYRHPGMGTIEVKRSGSDRRGSDLDFRIGKDDVLMELKRESGDSFLLAFHLENRPDGPSFELEAGFGGPPDGPVQYLEVAGDRFTAVK